MVLGKKTMTEHSTPAFVSWLVHHCCIATAWFLVVGLVSESAYGQFGFQLPNQPQAVDRADADKTELKTDPELEAILEKAERFKQDGNFRVATQLLQAVLERSGDSLYSDDGQLYFSLVREVESLLA